MSYALIAIVIAIAVIVNAALPLLLARKKAPGRKDEKQ